MMNEKIVNYEFEGIVDPYGNDLIFGDNIVKKFESEMTSEKVPLYLGKAMAVNAVNKDRIDTVVDNQFLLYAITDDHADAIIRNSKAVTGLKLAVGVLAITNIALAGYLYFSNKKKYYEEESEDEFNDI